MKSLVLGLILSFSVTGYSQDIEVMKSDKGVIETCARELLGCQVQIRLAEGKYTVSYDSLPKNLRAGIFTEESEEISLNNVEGHLENLPAPMNPMVTIDQFVLHQQDANAVIEMPEEGMIGGAPQIVVNGEKTLIDQATLTDEVRSYPKTTIPVSVKGYYAFEDGHFPNPGHEFKVFKILEIRINDAANEDRPDVNQEQRKKFSLPKIRRSGRRDSLNKLLDSVQQN